MEIKESSNLIDDYFQLFFTSLVPVLSAFLQFGVGAFICYSKLIDEDQAKGISTLMIKIFNPLYVIGIVGAVIDYNSISVLPVFAFNMAAIIFFGYMLGSFAVDYCSLPYFKSTIRAMVMFQNYFVLPTIILQETCASYGFLAGNVIQKNITAKALSKRLNIEAM
jgi:predicted permease